MAKKENNEVEEILSLDEIVDTQKESWIKPTITDVNTGDFRIKIKYLSADRIEEIRKSLVRIEYNPITGTQEEKVDTVEFAKNLMAELIQDWSGLTINVLKDLAPLSKSVLKKVKENPEFAKKEVPFTKDGLLKLAETSNKFVQYIMAVVNDPKVLNRDIDEDYLEKN